MQYHPIIGITIFLIAIIVSFLLGKNAFKKYKKKIRASNVEVLNTKSQISKPPQGEITAPDAPWLKK